MVMSKEIKLEAGQWYRSRGGEICFVVGKSAVFACGEDCWVVEESHGATETFTEDGFFLSVRSEHHRDLVEHLPGCDGFDWTPPKPIKPPTGWRLLTEGEIISTDDLWCDKDIWRNYTFSEAAVCGNRWDAAKHTPVARKIKPKYRPFTWEEFALHRDRWIVDAQDVRYRAGSYCNQGVQLTGVVADPVSYNVLFHAFRFEDGSMIGVEVTQ